MPPIRHPPPDAPSRVSTVVGRARPLCRACDRLR